MADTEFSHNIPRQIWNEFGPQLKSLGLDEKAFGFIDNYRAANTPNVSELPKLGLLGGASGHNGWDAAHSSAWQATREYLSGVFEDLRKGNTTAAQARSQIQGPSKT